MRMAPVTDGSAQGLAKLVDDHIKDNAIMVSTISKVMPFLHIFGTKEPSLLVKHSRRAALVTIGIAITSSHRPLWVT